MSYAGKYQRAFMKLKPKTFQSMIHHLILQLPVMPLQQATRPNNSFLLTGSIVQSPGNWWSFFCLWIYWLWLQISFSSSPACWLVARDWKSTDMVIINFSTRGTLRLCLPYCIIPWTTASFHEWFGRKVHRMKPYITEHVPNLKFIIRKKINLWYAVIQNTFLKNYYYCISKLTVLTDILL